MNKKRSDIVNLLAEKKKAKSFEKLVTKFNKANQQAIQFEKSIEFYQEILNFAKLKLHQVNIELSLNPEIEIKTTQNNSLNEQTVVNLSFPQDQSAITKNNSNTMLQKEPDIESLHYFQSIKSKESSKIRALFDGSLMKYQSLNKTDYNYSISELHQNYLKPEICDNSFDKSENRKQMLDYYIVNTSIDKITAINVDQMAMELNANKSNESFVDYEELLRSQRKNNNTIFSISHGKKSHLRKESSKGKIKTIGSGKGKITDEPQKSESNSNKNTKTQKDSNQKNNLSKTNSTWSQKPNTVKNASHMKISTSKISNRNLDKPEPKIMTLNDNKKNSTNVKSDDFFSNIIFDENEGLGIIGNETNEDLFTNLYSKSNPSFNSS